MFLSFVRFGIGEATSESQGVVIAMSGSQAVVTSGQPLVIIGEALPTYPRARLTLCLLLCVSDCVHIRLAN